MNAITAWYICYQGLMIDHSGVRSKEDLFALQVAQFYIVLNGITSCFMHSTLPRKTDPFWMQFLASLDGSSMLSAVAVALGVLSGGWVPGITLSVVLLLAPSTFDLFRGRIHEFTFAAMYIAFVLLMTLRMPEEHLMRHGKICLLMIFSTICQITDQFEPPKEGLNFIRRNVPLHAVWHVGAAYAVCEQVDLLKACLLLESKI